MLTDIDYIRENQIYPRPTVQCEECGIEKTLICGPKVRVHWRHKSNYENKCKDTSGESELHKLAKKWLMKYLNNKSSVNYIITCKLCKNSFNFVIPNLIYKEEKSDDVSRRWDIAGYENDKIIFGIEIYKTSKANPLTRLDIPWVEFEASEVVEKLDCENLPERITLKNINSNYCETCSEINRKNREEETRLWEEEMRLQTQMYQEAYKQEIERLRIEEENKKRDDEMRTTCRGDGSCLIKDSNGRYIRNEKWKCSNNCQCIKCTNPKCSFLAPLCFLNYYDRICRDCNKYII